MSGPVTSCSMLAAPRRRVAPAPLRRSRVASTTLTGGASRRVVSRRSTPSGMSYDAGRTDAPGVTDDPGEPEDPLLAAVGVEPHDVPAAGVADHAPRLEMPLELAVLTRVAGALVVELDRLARLRGVPEHVERRLVGAQPGLDQVEGRDVDLDAGGRQLADRVGGRLGQAGVLPDAGGQADHGRLVGGQADVGQGELVGRDAVARLVVEQRVDAADLDRHAQGPQLLLVALEHLLERVGTRVGIEDGADPLLGDVVALDEQHDEQVEQSFALPARRRLPRRVTRGELGHQPLACWTAQPAARMSITK